ncbi:MAG: hypothetical protein IPH18_17890 [Chitinophagaceae bacterium]|nr:hypothetical protein [Chitinophagaceae bacterium]
MKKIFINAIIPVATLLLVVSACTKQKDTGILDTAGYTDTASVLKDATDVTMGVAVGFSEMVTNASYSGIVKTGF